VPKLKTNFALAIIQKYGNRYWDNDTAQKALDEYIDALQKQGDYKNVLIAKKKKTSTPLYIQTFLYNSDLSREGLAVI
jgi:hypothetical protein